MLATKINGPDEYLAHSSRILTQTTLLQECPKIKCFYEDLCTSFKQLVEGQADNYFLQLGQLLAIDAQIQILLELTYIAKESYMNDFQMTEEEIIAMIQKDKNVFYRELTGGRVTEEPKWGLIYLSEAVADAP